MSKAPNPSAANGVWRILVVDDNPDIHVDVKKCLAPGAKSSALDALESEMFGTTASAAAAPTYEVVGATQGLEGVAACSRAIHEGRPFSAAFVDMRMPPGIDGLETIERLWKLDPSLQIILCTAFSDYSWKEISRRLGPRDNLLVLRKPFESIELQQMAVALCEKQRLAAAARTRLSELERLVDERTAELQEERRKDQRRLETLEEMVDRRTTELRRAALHDRLTGLPNRGWFAEQVNKAIRRAELEPSYGYAVLFLDCDRFKVVNDSLGHQCGDQLLVEIAQRLTAALGDTSDACAAATPARLGGDEFAVLLADTRSFDSAKRTAHRLLDALNKPARIQGHELRVGASIGVATSAHRYERAEDVIRDADTAMYKAKYAGRGRVVEFTPEMHADAMQRLVLENDLRRAIEGGALTVAYQPIVDLASGEVVALEALSRWPHPASGLISPTQFIPLAEETGLIVPLGDQVLRRSCEQLATWANMLPTARIPKISVNVSRKQLVDPQFAARLRSIVESTGVPHEYVVLEITESTVMDHMETAMKVLEAARVLGLGVYMDDFGTGHSSLACLEHFPLTGLKIDQSFTSGDRKEPYRTALVQAIIAVARNMRIPVIAEGVETVEDVAWLQTLGCDRAQGFFFSQPANAGSIEGMLLNPGAWVAFDGVQRFLGEAKQGSAMPAPVLTRR